jgi:hypothetical protein
MANSRTFAMIDGRMDWWPSLGAFVSGFPLIPIKLIENFIDQPHGMILRDQFF